MKQVLLIFTMLLTLPVLVYGQVIADYDEAPADTNYWTYYENVLEGAASAGVGGHYLLNPNASPDTGYIKYSYVDDPVAVGAGAFKIEYSAHNKEGWGGFSKIEHWNPDSNKVYNFTGYDSISVMYNITAKQTLPGRVHLRFCLQDVSDAENGANTYSNTDCEYYYSFNYEVLDSDPGWHELKLPLKADPNYWNGEGFNRTGWAGILGNDKLDLHQIKGYSLEFSIDGGGTGDFSEGTIVIDHLTLKGLGKIDLVFFNGKAIPPDMEKFAWSGGLEVVEGAGATEGTNAMMWTQGEGQAWTGAGFNFAAPANLLKSWKEDSISFKMKAQSGTGKLRLQFEDGSVPHLGLNFDPIADDAWHDYKFALADFVLFDGDGAFDTSAVTVFQWLAEGTGSGKTIYIDDMWTGNPSIDVFPPAIVTNVKASKGEYYNIVSWDDVEGESGAFYNVYASTEPIVDVTADGIELLEKNVAEGTGQINHWLFFPLVPGEVSYYYAVECIDAAGNVGPAGLSSISTNNAKPWPTISMEVPPNFAADGDLSEWNSSGIMPFIVKGGEDNTVGTVTDSLDLKGTIYLAIDDDFIYLGADVIDDSYQFTDGNWYDMDALQVYIGLYNQTGAAHTSYSRGEEPDYNMYFNEEGFFFDGPGDRQGHRVYANDGNANYYFEELGGADYVVEVKIPLDTMVYRDEDVRFDPERGMKIPFEIFFHDRDNGNWEGNIGLSKNNTDQAWNNPAEWFYTWIGDTNAVTSISDFAGNIANSYYLEQNYPNPFNPSTTIQFAIAKPGNVEIVVYNLLGQSVTTLLNERMEMGTHQVKFDGANLSSGIYFYSIKSADFYQTRKMILLK